jgi:hypothetical protein
VRPVKTWIKAFAIAGVLEAPQVLFLARSIGNVGKSNVALNVIGWYHVLGIWFGQWVLLVWNPGPRPGPTPTSNVVAWFSVFAFQVALTTPIIYGLLRWMGFVRRKRESKGRP